MTTYYTLPKQQLHDMRIAIKSQEKEKEATTEKEQESICISHTTLHYLNQIQQAYDAVLHNPIKQIVNQYEFMLTKVPGSNMSVVASNIVSTFVIDMIEINHLFHLLPLSTTVRMQQQTYHFQNHHLPTVACLTDDVTLLQSIDVLKEHLGVNIETISFSSSFTATATATATSFSSSSSSSFSSSSSSSSFSSASLAFFDVVLCDCCLSLSSFAKTVCNALKCLKSKGSIVLKVDMLMHKSILDALFLLNCIFDKVCIVKPNTSDVTNGEKYVVCKNLNLWSLWPVLQLIHEKTQLSLPCHWMTKMEDINLSMTHEQINALLQIVNFAKYHKANDEKFEHLKRSNIQKCVMWCEKHNLPHNKFIEHINMFLTSSSTSASTFASTSTSKPQNETNST